MLPWILVAVFVLLLVAASAADAFAFAMLALLLTGLSHLVRGRSSVSRLIGNGRRRAAVPLLASFIAFILFGVTAQTADDTLAAEPAPTTTVSTTPSATPSPTMAASPTLDAPAETPASPAPSPPVTATPASEPTTVEPEPIPVEAETGGQAAVLLSELPIKGRAPKTGYDRDQFGQRWADIDRNGCDQRNDILNRDLIEVTHKPGTRNCVVLTGTLHDPFTAKTIHFVRGEGTSNAVQIDHVVALSDAWQKGAQQLNIETRTLFANDPLNLLAVDGPTNASKGDGDAATWLPPNKSFRCDYVARQVAVKHTYGLWVTQAEHDAIKRTLDSCPGQTAPTSTETPSASPTTTSAPTPTPAPTTAAPPQSPPPAPDPPADVYYKNCTEAREAGAAPIRIGEPGYGKHLDRDGDGVACE